MLCHVHVHKRIALSGALALVGLVAAQQAQPRANQPPTGAPAGRGGRGGGAGAPGRGSRFKIYPAEAIERGLPAYNTTCGYCHGERGKGGKAGPDLIASLVTLHDEDGVDIAKFVRAPAHAKVVKIDASDNQIFDIAAYLHSRVIYASGRGGVRMSEVLVGDAAAGQQYFNGAGGCNKCHSPTGDLKGVGAKYDVRHAPGTYSSCRAPDAAASAAEPGPNPTRLMPPSRCRPAKRSKARPSWSPTSM